MKVETIAQQLFFCTIRAEIERPDGLAVGTVFAVGYERDGKSFPFLVTNKHVVENAAKARFFFVKAADQKPALGERVDIFADDFARLWTGHPDTDVDVAVAPLGPLLQQLEQRGLKPFYRLIPLSVVPTPQQLDELDAIEEVTFVGYPVGLFDTVNLLPVIRRGTTATPINVDYRGEAKFLIDAAVFHGSSGSPVFIFNQGTYSHRGGVVVGSRLLLVGTISAVVSASDSGELEFIEGPSMVRPVVRLRQLLNLGVVEKASKITESVEHALKVAGAL